MASNQAVRKHKTNRFNRSYSQLLTCDSGYVVPIRIEEYIPGDVFYRKIKEHIRMLFPLTPTFGNIVVDEYAVSIPDVVIDKKHTEEFWGQSDETWEDYRNVGVKNRPTLKKIIPPLAPPKEPQGNTTPIPCYGWDIGTLADYLNMPTGKHYATGLTTVEILKNPRNYIDGARYIATCNTLHRNPMLQQKVMMPGETLGKSAVYSYEGNEDILEGKDADYTIYNKYYETLPYLGNLYPANRLYDYITSCTIDKQFGEAIAVELAGEPGVYTSRNANDKINNGTGLHWYDANNGQRQNAGTIGIEGVNHNTALREGGNAPINSNIIPGNLITDMSQAGMQITAFRDAYALEDCMATINETGNLYRQIINGLYDVEPAWTSVETVELITAKRNILTMQQVIQESAGTTESPLGAVAGFSNSINDGLSFTKAFDIHGAIMLYFIIRIQTNYGDGCDRHLLDTEWTDKYNPLLANISDQPVYQEEFDTQYWESVATPLLPVDPMANHIHGYNYSWESYRTNLSRATGHMRPLPGELGEFWSYAQKFGTQEGPAQLNEAFILEPQAPIKRTLANTEIGSQQTFLCKFDVTAIDERPLPIHPVRSLGGY